MRVFNLKDAVSHLQEGPKGALEVLNVVQEDDVECGIRRLPPRSHVAGGRGSEHHHLVYTVRGTGTVTNGEYYEKVAPGTFVLFEHGDRPGYQTGDEELVVLEVAWRPERRDGPAAPAMAPATARHPTRHPAIATVVPKGSYEEV